MEITILTEQDLRQCVQMDESALEAIAEGFSQLVVGKVSVPPIMRIDITEKHGEVDVKSAYIAGKDSFAIKIASGFHENRLLCKLLEIKAIGFHDRMDLILAC